MLMPIIVELTYEDDTKRHLNIQLKFGKNNDTAKRKYMLLKSNQKIQIGSKLRNS
jgi:hypothetical protein